MKTDQDNVSSGKITFCLDCKGTGLEYRDDRCWKCGGFGLLFDRKNFSTSLTTTRVVPDKAGNKLIRAADDLHEDVLVKHHRNVLKRKVQLIENYRKAMYILRDAERALAEENIIPSEIEL
jgi:DnaJ-class molecular chaperone